MLINIRHFSRQMATTFFFFTEINSNLKIQSRMLSTNKINVRKDVLDKINIKESDIDWPVQSSLINENVNYIDRNPSSTSNMYSNSNLADIPIFKGKYINFGYWMGIDYNDLTDEKRIESAQKLYELIGRRAEIKWDSVVLELGCGNGKGATHLMYKHNPAVYVGLDINYSQIERARDYNEDIINQVTSNRLRFVQGSSENIPFFSNSFTNVVSVEAAQHFTNLNKSISEVSRVLKPGGNFVFTTFFAKNKEGVDSIESIMPDYKVHCSDLTIDEVGSMMDNKMDNIEINSIGNDVWPGLMAWLKHIKYDRQWTILWPKLFEAGLIDYYVLKGTCRSTESKENSSYQDSGDFHPKLNM